MATRKKLRVDWRGFKCSGGIDPPARWFVLLLTDFRGFPGYPGFPWLSGSKKVWDFLDIDLNDREVSSPLWHWPLKDHTWAFAIAQTDRSIWVLTLAFFLIFSGFRRSGAR